MVAYWKIILCAGLLLFIYSLLFYLQINLHLRIDFTSFYTAAIAYSSNLNPFQDLVPSFLPATKLPANLNPPAFLQLISPIIHLHFITALSLWFILSLLLGISGTLISFYLSTTKEHFKKNWPMFILLYLAMYPTIMNSSIGQLGGLVLFLTMAGYYFFLRQKDFWSGLFWGCLIAIKLFPGLLFLFVLSQKRYKVFSIMLLCCVSLSLIPLLTKGESIYFLYTHLLSQVFWYGESWNGSLFGFLVRIFVNADTHQGMYYTQIVYYVLFVVMLFWYSKKLLLFKNKKMPHYAFCLTLIMMQLMSPFGWMYYFSLLMMPLTLIWQAINKQSSSIWNNMLWVLSLFLINAPLGNVQEHSMNHFIYKISIYSIYFYGLLLILYLLLCLGASEEDHQSSKA
jgi:hypothetical protein